jgi:hypothetical protein
LIQQVRDAEGDKNSIELKEAYAKQELTSQLKHLQDNFERTELENSKFKRESEDREEEAKKLRTETLTLKAQLMDQEKNRETFMKKLVESQQHTDYKKSLQDSSEFARGGVIVPAEKDYY